MKHAFVATLAVSMAAVVCVVIALTILAGVLSRGPLDLPQARDFVETALNERLTDGRIRIGSVSLRSANGGVANRLQLKNVTLLDGDGARVLSLADVRTAFSLRDLVRGTMAPSEVTVVDTRLVLRRAEDGSIDLLSGGSGADIPDLARTLDDIAARPEFASLRQIDLSGAQVTLEDALTGRSFAFDNSTLTLTRDGQRFQLRAAVALAEKGVADETPALLRLSADYTPGASETAVAFQFEEADPSQIADLFRAFDWLRQLDTRASGSMRATVASDGVIAGFSGVLDLGQGRLTGTPDSVPVRFDRAKVYFDYAPGQEVLNLTQIVAETSSGSLNATGYAQLTRDRAGRVQAMTGQLRLSDIVIDRPDLFDAPVGVAEAALDARLSFDPLRLDVGQLVIFDEGETIRLSGQSRADGKFWTNRYDVDVSGITHTRLKELWPKPAVHKTREWLFKNIADGRVSGFRGGMRSKGGDFDFDFKFYVADANVQLIETVPYLEKGRGFASLTQDDFRIHLTSGHVTAQDGTRVALDGSSVYIPDIEARPTPGEISLRAAGGLTAALHILDSERFSFLTKAGLGTDLASGDAVARAEFRLPLSKGVQIADVKFDLDATLTGVRSDTLVKGRELRAEKLNLSAQPAGLELSGPMTLDGVPVRAVWSQPFGRASDKGSSVSAQVQLSDANLRALGVALPPGAVSGNTTGQMDIALRRGQPPAYTLTSDLRGARLSVPAIGWTKPAESAGSLLIRGTLGAAPTVDMLTLEGGGLTATGQLELAEGGKLTRAVLSEVKVGGWLDTSAVIEPREAGSDITLTGGTLDLRGFAPSGSGGGGGGATRVSALIDRVIVTREVSLSNVSARLTSGNGLSGGFSGRVNGGAEIAGRIFPQTHGAAFELTSNNAGGVLASAGLLKNAKWGDMRVVLVPTQGKGNYDGTLNITRVRLKDTSAMADLLNAISLVGLIQQLNGSGIHFSTVEGQFALRDGAVQLRNVAAVGPSMGITLDGYYNADSKTVDFAGVTTPLYAVNGVLERLFGPLVGRGKGEGMFSFTYRMRGPAENPRVAVNPLSILTPGAFRELFRTRAPQPPEGFRAAQEGAAPPRASSKQSPGAVAPPPATADPSDPPALVPKQKRREAVR